MAVNVNSDHIEVFAQYMIVKVGVLPMGATTFTVDSDEDVPYKVLSRQPIDDGKEEVRFTYSGDWVGEILDGGGPPKNATP